MNKIVKIVLIVVLIIVLILAGYFGYKYCKEKKDETTTTNTTTSTTTATSSDFKDKIEEDYYTLLKDIKDSDDKTKYGLPDDLTSSQITFIVPASLDTTVMVYNYEKDGLNYVTLFYEDSDGTMENIPIEVPSELVYLFNEKTNSFNYYIEEINPNNDIVSYESVTNLIKNGGSIVDSLDTTNNSYIYSGNTTVSEISSNIVTHLSETDNEVYSFFYTDVPDDILDASRDIKNNFYKFDEIFIVPTKEKIEYYSIDLKDTDDTLKQDVKNAYDNLKKSTDLETDDIKAEIEEKLEIIKDKISSDEKDVINNINTTVNEVKNSLEE